MGEIYTTTRCSKCNGSGDMDCPNCNGTGYNPYGGQCHRCYGEGTVTCDRCGGSGTVRKD
ncbi:MAG: hypothetical protein IKT38_07560 [Clostridia bacterium]|nr:hypothetical protein [Clostridia bacterium]